ncbi:thioesterase domain-containing protein [Paenibacillus sp. 102]|uniref:thioesterase II family protein n=1 Tax=Paenibacillus sp. 102 TaxID=3120823 RepID=UPI0031BAD293
MSIVSLQNKWFIPLEDKTKIRTRLFCFPYAGGNTSVYRNWRESLSPEIGLWPVQLPGREQRLLEEPICDLFELARNIADEIEPLLEYPFSFFGHSMGALVSFEVARELRRRNCPQPIKLFVSGRHAPQIANVNLPIHNLREEEFISKLRKLNGTPEEVLENEELMQLFLPMIRADFQAVETYEYIEEQPLSSSIVVFSGMDDTEVSMNELTSWKKQTIKSCNVEMFPGNHFFLHKQKKGILQTIENEVKDYYI